MPCQKLCMYSEQIAFVADILFVVTVEPLLAFNPLTTDHAFWHCLTFDACYQMAQSILNKVREIA